MLLSWRSILTKSFALCVSLNSPQQIINYSNAFHSVCYECVTVRVARKRELIWSHIVTPLRIYDEVEDEWNECVEWVVLHIDYMHFICVSLHGRSSEKRIVMLMCIINEAQVTFKTERRSEPELIRLQRHTHTQTSSAVLLNEKKNYLKRHFEIRLNFLHSRKKRSSWFPRITSFSDTEMVEHDNCMT